MALAYEKRQQYDRERQQKETFRGTNIHPIPKCAEPQRREATRLNLVAFCDTYFSAAFKLKWSEDHIRVIRKIEAAVLKGGLSAYAMPRGSGKTTISRVAAIWAILHGHRKWICIVGATDAMSTRLLGAIKKDLRFNPLLVQDFPEAVYPIKKIDGVPKRAENQHINGHPTSMEWTAERIVFPTVEGSPASGAIITVAGLTGNIRGQVDNKQDGTVIRPDLVFLDDPQTKESAGSDKQNHDRLEILNGDILGLAGPDVAISGLMACTVIRPGDMADTILDTTQSPEWRGERTKLVYAFPENETLWEQYFSLRDQSLGAGNEGEEATAFYLENRAAMDAGSVVAWPERHPPKFASALEFAMVLRNREPSVFAAEYQNEPLISDEERGRLTSTEIASRVNGFERLAFPREVEHLTAFIDVQEKALYYVVAAWSQDFTGYVIDYGTFPEQGRRYFALRDIQRTLQAAIGGTLENQWFEGLGKLTDTLCFKEWARADGAKLKMGRVLIDANYGYSTKTVKRFCQVSKWAPILLATHGRGIKAGDLPIAQWPPKAGERKGHNWLIRKDAEAQSLRHLIYDVNYWKSFIHNRLRLKAPAPESLSLWGNDPRQHEMFADHLVAEIPVRTEGRNRTVEEWQEKPDRPDNHLFDCAVGCAVGASILGAEIGQARQEKRPSAKPQTKLNLARPDGRSFFVTDR